MMSSEYIVIRIMCHNIFNIAIQNIAEFINRIDFYILIMPVIGLVESGSYDTGYTDHIA